MTSPSPRGLLLGLGLSLALAACGDDTGGAGGGGGSSSGDGGGEEGGGGGGPAVDPSTLPDSGSIVVSQWLDDHNDVSASFQRGRRAAPSEDCEVQEDGPCTRARCGQPDEPSDTTFLDAGSFGLTGTLVEIIPVRNERGEYLGEGRGRLFAPSSELVATFSGGEVPPAALELRAPPRLAAVDPSFDALVVTPGQDLEITWELDGGEGLVDVLLWADRPFGGIDTLFCRFDAEQLAATVPGAMIPPGEPVVAWLGTVVEDHVAVGTHDVTVTVYDLAAIGTYSLAPDWTATSPGAP